MPTSDPHELPDTTHHERGRPEREHAARRSVFSTTREEGEQSYTQRDLLRVLFKHRVTILLCFGVATVVTAAGMFLTPPTYTSSAKVLVRTELQSNPSFFSGVAALDERRGDDPVNRRIETEMELIETAPLAESVVRELGLTWKQVYHTPLTYVTEPLIGAYEWTRRAVFGIPPDPERHGFRATVRAMQKGLLVGALKSKSSEAKSDIVQISLRAPSASLAQKALAVLLDHYTRFDTRFDEEAGQRALNLVTAEVGRAEGQVKDSQARLASFLGSTGFITPDATAGADSTTASILNRVRGTLITTPRDDSSIQELKTSLVSMEVDLVQASQLYKPTSEQIQQRMRAIASLRHRIDEEVKQNAVNYSRFNELDRELRAAEARYNALQVKQSEIALFVQVRRKQSFERVVVEQPSVPDSSDWKKRLAIVLLGSVTGMMLGAGFAGLGEYTAQTMDSKSDIRRHFGLDVLAVVPEASPEELDSTRLAELASSENGFRSGQRLPLVFRSLVSRLLMTGHSGVGGRTVLVTSVAKGEGKTTVASALAVQLARRGCGNVLLADANFADPQLHRRFIVSNDVHFHAVLAGNSSAEPQVGQSGTPGLTVLPAGDDLEHSLLLLNQERVKALLQKTALKFDWVILDAGSVSDGFVSTLAQFVDVRLLVVDSQRTRHQVIREALQQLDLDSRDLFWVVLNKQRRYIPQFLYKRF